MATIRVGLRKPEFADDSLISAEGKQQPEQEQLLAYAREIQGHLDGFLADSAYHRVCINQGRDFIECILEVTQDEDGTEVDEGNVQRIDVTLTQQMGELDDEIKCRLQQCIASRKLLPLYDKNRVYLYKMPWAANWTVHRAVEDANCIIYQCVKAGMDAKCQRHEEEQDDHECDV